MHNTESYITYLTERVNCDNLDFSKTVYVNRLTPMTITCKIHGDFIKRVAYIKYPKNSNKLGICPRCTIIQRELDRNKTNVGYIYLSEIKSDTELFYKLGYTQYDPEKRFTIYNLPGEYSNEIVYSEYYDDPKKAIDRELFLHKEYIGYRYKPDKKFYGYEECYEVNIIDVEGIKEI